MIKTNDSIRYQNVLTQKRKFHYTDMQEALEDFLKKVDESGCKKVGPLCYALHNIPTDEMTEIEFFMPVREYDVQSKDLQFNSYYAIEDMLSTYVFGDYELNMEMAYSALVEFMRAAKLESVTPFYHVVDRERRYIKVMLGYRGEKQD